jgi:hypothetical protein
MNRIITDLELQVSNLKDELRVKTEKLEVAMFDIARLTTEAQTNRGQPQHAQALRSTTATTSRYWAPAQQAGDSVSLQGPQPYRPIFGTGCDLFSALENLDVQTETSYGPADMRQQPFSLDARLFYAYKATVDDHRGVSSFSNSNST